MPRLTDAFPTGVVESTHRTRFPLAGVAEAGLRLAGPPNTSEVKTAITPVPRVAGVALLGFGDAAPTDTRKLKLAIECVSTDAPFIRTFAADALPADKLGGAIRVIAVITGATERRRLCAGAGDTLQRPVALRVPRTAIATAGRLAADPI